MLVEALRRHLELARRGLLTTRRFPTWLDDARRSARLLEIFEAEQAKLEGAGLQYVLQIQVSRWDDSFARTLVENLIECLADASFLSEEPDKDDATIDRAVRDVLSSYRIIAAEEPWATGVRGRRLNECCREANERARAERSSLGGFAPYRYADELQLARTSRGATTLRPAGEIFLGLRGRDAIRWMLALEVCSSLGDKDPWRISASRAQALASERSVQFVDDGEPRPWPWNCDTERFVLHGLVEVEARYEDGRVWDWRCRVTPLGSELFGELEQASGEALRSLARSVLADEAHFTFHGRPPVVSAVSGLGRHTTMVAHELRNALVPVQFSVKQLRRQLAGEGLTADDSGALDAIAGGIERALRFVVETARMASHGAAQDELFGVEAAVRDAIETVNPEVRQPIELSVALGIDRVYLRGWRDHFVLALLNLLRNAVQAGDEEIRIYVACEAAARGRGRVLIVHVEDDGPGVPADRRTEIFADGVSLRAGGTGHGLAFVREVVEDEFKGSVQCEQSPRGGARFVVRLPIPLEGET